METNEEENISVQLWGLYKKQQFLENLKLRVNQKISQSLNASEKQKLISTTVIILLIYANGKTLDSKWESILRNAQQFN